MSEILTLAEQFKQKSTETAQSIDNELNSVMQTLNESMIAKLKESENIISNGTASLSEQSEQLQLMLQQHEQDTHTALTSYTSKVQALTGKGLSEHTDAVQTMIESYTASVQSLIENKQDEINQVIKSDMSKWATLAGIAVLMIFILGALLGAWIAKAVTDPQPLIYKHDPRTNQAYLVPVIED